MPCRPPRVDVVIVGAGIAGAAAAAMLAEGGRQVVLLDRRDFDQAGARWVNGVPAWAFVVSGVAPPRPPERRVEGETYVLAGPSARPRLRVTVPDVWSVDMRLLGERMRRWALAVGVQPWPRTTLLALAPGREGGWRLETTAGTVSCRLLVDASGLRAVARRLVWPLAPEVAIGDVCTAAQAVYGIADAAGAERFAAEAGIHPGEVLGISGLAGGYSVLNVALDGHAGEVALLTGTIPATGATSGLALMERFVQAQPWIGPRQFGGAGAIPIRRPLTRLVAPGFALLGDAACQVFPAHGSGIAMGLCAARLLAEAVLAVPAGQMGSLESLWVYAATFHRRYGGILAGYDLVRRTVQELDALGSERLLASGLLTPESVTAGLRQHWPAMAPHRLASVPAGLARAPREAWQLAKALSRMPFVRQAAAQYPLTPDDEALARYERRLAGLMGGSPSDAASIDALC